MNSLEKKIAKYSKFGGYLIAFAIGEAIVLIFEINNLSYIMRSIDLASDNFRIRYFRDINMILACEIIAILSSIFVLLLLTLRKKQAVYCTIALLWVHFFCVSVLVNPSLERMFESVFIFKTGSLYVILWTIYFIRSERASIYFKKGKFSFLEGEYDISDDAYQNETIPQTERQDEPRKKQAPVPVNEKQNKLMYISTVKTQDTPQKKQALARYKIKKLKTEYTKILEDANFNTKGVEAASIYSYFDQMIEQHKEEFDTWGDDVDYTYVAYSIMANCTFDLLCSGKYHLYRGILNWHGENIKRLYDFCMNHALNIGEVTPEILKEQYEMLREGIKIVG